MFKKNEHKVCSTSKFSRSPSSMTQIRKSSKQILRNRQQKRVFFIISLSTDLILGESELVSKFGLYLLPIKFYKKQNKTGERFLRKHFHRRMNRRKEKIHSIAGIYLFKINNRNTRTRCKICSKLIIKTIERRQWRRFGVFIVNLEHLSHLNLAFLLLTLSRLIPAGSSLGIESQITRKSLFYL